MPLVAAVAERVDRVRLLYLYPSDLTDGLIDAMCAIGDAVLRPVAAARVAARCCDGCVGGATASGSSRRIADIRAREPDAAFRSNFIVGYPGETEADHDAAAGASSRRPSSTGAGSSPSRPRTAPTPSTLDGQVDPSGRRRPPGRAARAPGPDHGVPARRARSAPCIEVLVDEPGVARSHREAPEIDGVVVGARRPRGRRAAQGDRGVGASGPDLEGRPT